MNIIPENEHRHGDRDATTAPVIGTTETPIVETDRSTTRRRPVDDHHGADDVVDQETTTTATETDPSPMTSSVQERDHGDDHRRTSEPTRTRLRKD